MAPRSPHLKNLLLTASLLSTRATAQNATNTTAHDSCSTSSPEGIWSRPANATGTWNMTDLTDLYISLTFSETRTNPSNTTAISIFSPWTLAYLSAPKNSTTQACVFTFAAVDNRRQGSGPNGCDGVLSPACQSAIEQSYQFPINVLDVFDRESRRFDCSDISVDSDEMYAACGPGYSGTSSTSQALNMTNTTCAIPAPLDFNLPDDSNTRALFAVGPTQAPWEYDTDVDNFTWYDEYVTRPVPVVVAFANQSDGRVGSRIVCVAPDGVREGSRVPGGSVNRENVAVGVEWGWRGGVAGLVAGVVGMVSVLG